MFESDRRKSKSKSIFQPKGNINNYNIFKGKKKKKKEANKLVLCPR